MIKQINSLSYYFQIDEAIIKPDSNFTVRPFLIYINLHDDLQKWECVFVPVQLG